MERLCREYSDRMQPYLVYVREAHPDDGWQMKSNKRDGVVYDTPKSLRERARIATDCVRELGLTMPCLLDGMDNAVQMRYRGFPARACLVGKDGRIVFISKAGPRGISPKEIEQALRAQVG